jgi:neutral ceramidase
MNKNYCLLSLFCAAILSSAVPTAVVGQELKAGAATSNITPPLGKDIIGGFQPFPSKHIHDELHARCLVLDDGKTRLALVVCDLLGIHRNVSDLARKLIQESSGIPPERVLISATHTHSASSALGQNRFKHDQEVDEYQQFVARRIADGVKRAVNRLRPAQIGFGTAQAPEHIFNRRWYMKPGTMPLNPFGELDQVKMNPPAGSPNLLEPAGPTDPTISFLAVRDMDGKPISVYAAYSLHYVGGVADADISADYFGMFCSHLEHLLEADHPTGPFVALLANGTSGDINNINFRNPRPRQDPYVQMRIVAEDVATKVHEALGKVEYKSKVTLDARYRELAVTWRKPTPEQAAWAKATLEKGPAAEGKTDLSYIYAERTTRLAEYPETAKVPLQVLRIGDVCLGTMPCEVFCEIGLDFKSRSPLPKSFLVSLGHGYLGYLPTPRQHRLGGYETWIGTNRLEPNASEKMLDSLLEMAKETKTSLENP